MELLLGLVLLLAALVTIWRWVSNKAGPRRPERHKGDEVEFAEWEWLGNKLGCLIIAIVIAVVVGYPIFVLFIAPMWSD